MQSFLNKHIKWIFISSFVFTLLAFLLTAYGISHSHNSIADFFQWVLLFAVLAQVFICITSFILIITNVIKDSGTNMWWFIFFLATLAELVILFSAMPRC